MEDSAWEFSKENIQPLKQGRQPTILSKALRMSTVNVPANTGNGDSQSIADGSTNSSAAVRALILQQEKQEFEDSLKTCMTTSDPLSVYYRYIRWIEETHPAGKEKEIRELVNKCLTSLGEKFKDKYANDIRWLYVWLKFASLSKSMGSQSVYEFMRANNHCIHLAGFYLQWASELEHGGHYDEAAKIFQSGIQMDAQPMPSLVSAYEEFQARCARRMMEQQRNAAGDEEDDTRNVLGILTTGAPRRATSAVTTPYMRISRPEEVKCGKATPSIDNRRPSTFAIFNDGQDNGSSSRMSIDVMKAMVNRVPCEKVLCKENAQKADVWTKSKIDQASFVKKTPTIGSQQSKFAIYVDDSVVSHTSATEPPKSKAHKKFEAGNKQKTADGAFFACNIEKMLNGSMEVSVEELRAARWAARRETVVPEKSTPALRLLPIATPSVSRPALNSVADSVFADQPVVTKVQPTNEWKAAPSPPGNTSFTRNLYREAMAAFSNTLQLSGAGPSAEIDDSSANQSRQSSAVVPKGSSAAAGFVIYEDPETAGRKSEDVPKEEADKENIDPKVNRGSDGIEKKRRNVAGILCASTEFPCMGEKDKDNVIIVEEDEYAGGAPCMPASSTTSGNNHTLNLDFNESTVAGFHRFFPANGNRAISTPCSNVSRIQPLSLSSFKPLDLADAEDTGKYPPIAASELAAMKSSGDHQIITKEEYLLSADIVMKNPNTEQKLSTIVETSREYKSGASSSSSSAASGNTRRRLLSGASGLSGMPSVTETGVVRMMSAFNTPYSDGGFGNGAMSSGKTDNDGVRCFDGTPYEKDLTNNKSGGYKPNAVRKLLLDDQGELAEGEAQDDAGFNLSINPWTPAFVGYQLAHARRLENYTNYHTFEENVPFMKAGRTVSLGGETYLVLGVAGEGAYAKVFKCHLENEDSCEFVLKVQKPCCPIEFYICQELHNRLKAQNLLNIVDTGLTQFRDAFMFDDGSVLVGDFSPYGTLVDLINIYKQLSSDQCLPEVIVAYLTADILRIMEAVHGQKIIHGDVKPDNFLVLNTPSLDSQEPSQVRSVRLIDWGRSIDMALVPPSTTFSGKSNTSGFVCCEMQDGRPWTYQTDYYGILGTVHVLAFGDYMSTYKVASTNTWRISRTFKRRWDDRLWKEFFDVFLNVPDCQSLPVLGEWRKRFDEFVRAARTVRPSAWTSEVKKMQDVLLELKRSIAKKKNLM